MTEFGYDNLDTGYVGWVEGGILGQPVDPRGVFRPQYQGVQLATCVGDDRPRSWACNETQNNFKTRILVTKPGFYWLKCSSVVTICLHYRS